MVGLFVTLKQSRKLVGVSYFLPLLQFSINCKNDLTLLSIIVCMILRYCVFFSVYPFFIFQFLFISIPNTSTAYTYIAGVWNVLELVHKYI